MYSTETELRAPVHRFFRSKKFKVYDEVRLLTRTIDVVARKGHEICAVELKLRDWERAIAQAYLNLRVADYSYVALPRRTVDRNAETLFVEAQSSGIGLIQVAETAREILQPQPSARSQPCLKQRFLANFHEG